ncbi:hypothetical protein [Deinococcus sp. UYEF24]
MRSFPLICILLMPLGITACKQQGTTSKVTVQVSEKSDALKEIAEYEPKINQIFLDVGLNPIKCPEYLRDEESLRPGDVNTCFVSARQPEELIPLLSDALKAFSEVSMGWRMDLGTWTTHRKFKSNQEFSVTLTAPGLREDARSDPKVNKAGTVATLFMGYDPNP